MSFCGGDGVVGRAVGWKDVCTVIFVFNPTTVLRLCCVVAGVVTFVTQHLTSVENLGTIFSLSFCMILQKKGNIQILITQVL